MAWQYNSRSPSVLAWTSNSLIGAQRVVDLMVFMLRRSYANSSHAGVKDILVFRTESLHTMARRSLGARTYHCA